MSNISSKKFYEKSYSEEGSKAQREYPNEELCRFIGRRFGNLSRLQKQKLKLIEMGCGSGANIWMLARESFNTYGIDFSGKALNLCEKVLDGYDVNAKLFKADMTNTGFTDNYFDVCVDVFSSNCLNAEQGKKFLSELSRILKVGGIFFSYFPSKCSDAFKNHHPSKLIDEHTLNGIYRKDSPFYCQPYNFRFLDLNEYKELLQEHGFIVQYSEITSRSYGTNKEVFSWCVIEGQKR